MDWQTSPATGLEAAITDFKAALPGWWFTVGECQVSADASCGPTREVPNLRDLLLSDSRFDDGFHADLPQPDTMPNALRSVTRDALDALAGIAPANEANPLTTGDHHHVPRGDHVMRAKKIKQDLRGPLQKMFDGAETARQQSELLVITPEQRLKGTYEGERRIINRGGTPVMRWLASGKISDTQGLAIQTCYRLWALVGLEQRTTAEYGERISGSADISDERSAMLVEAREDLHRIRDYVPPGYWSVFENVCRFDEPAGIAGSRLGSARGAEDRAHTIVCFVADIIAMKERLVPVTRILAA